MSAYLQKYPALVKTAAAAIKRHFPNGFQPDAALTLGSGLADLEKSIQPVFKLPYSAIPHFPESTVAGHKGELIGGYLAKVPILGFSGRKHYYEVAGEEDAMFKVTFAVQTAATLKCRLYLATNAAGGLNPNFNVGDLMLINSHIGFFLPNPLTNQKPDFGDNPYFQPLHQAYDQELRQLFQKVNPQYRQFIKEGVYVAVSGRTYETQAECLFLRKIGADAVGMSTVPEVIVAENRGLKTLAVSLITNKINRQGVNATSHTEVVAVLNDEQVKKRTAAMFENFFAALFKKF